MDRGFAERLRQERAVAGSDRWDEVWEGTYMMTPLPNNEHQELVGGFVDVFRELVPRGKGLALPGANVSDREKGWEHNYRCPDVVVYFEGTSAKNCNTHWLGGPDFAVEIVSDDDRSRDKIPFYAQVGTRELLLVERDPWNIELLRLDRGVLTSVGTSTVKAAIALASEVLPLSFRLIDAEDRPSIEIVRSTDGKKWQM
jgi:Uma2 family endonuclease